MTSDGIEGLSWTTMDSVKAEWELQASERFRLQIAKGRYGQGTVSDVICSISRKKQVILVDHNESHRQWTTSMIALPAARDCGSPGKGLSDASADILNPSMIGCTATILYQMYRAWHRCTLNTL